MHNLLSSNQLSEWGRSDNDVKNWEEYENQKNLLNDYYECLIECDTSNQASCKRICKEVLM
jgi:hypothetical protein